MLAWITSMFNDVFIHQGSWALYSHMDVPIILDNRNPIIDHLFEQYHFLLQKPTNLATIQLIPNCWLLQWRDQLEKIFNRYCNNSKKK